MRAEARFYSTPAQRLVEFSLRRRLGTGAREAQGQHKGSRWRTVASQLAPHGVRRLWREG